MAVTEPIPEDLRLLKVQEVLKILRISDVHFYKLLKEGKGPPVYRMGRCLRFPVAQLRAWMENTGASPRKRGAK